MCAFWIALQVVGCGVDQLQETASNTATASSTSYLPHKLTAAGAAGSAAQKPCCQNVGVLFQRKDHHHFVLFSLLVMMQARSALSVLQLERPAVKSSQQLPQQAENNIFRTAQKEQRPTHPDH